MMDKIRREGNFLLYNLTWLSVPVHDLPFLLPEGHEIKVHGVVSCFSRHGLDVANFLN
jgi:hypothetical protein